MTNTTTHTKPLLPKLRFKEFEGEWEEIKIGEVLKIGSGKDYKHLEEGKIPVYGTGGLMTYVDKYLYEGESVCIGRKGTIDKPVYLNEKFWTVDTLFYTHSFKKSLPKFVFGIFERINWKLYNEASGVPSLSKSTIEKIKVSIPNLPEQQKIANFLTAVDTKLQQLTTKKETLALYKKGVMQQLFSQQLRFKPDVTNETVIARTQDEAISPNETQFPDWEEKLYGDIYTFYSTNSFSRDNLNYEKGKVKNIHYGDIHTKFSMLFNIENENVPFVNEEIDLSKIKPQNYCQIGDLVIADASEDYNDIGKSIEIINLDNNPVLAGLHTFLARPNKYDMELGFSSYLMQSWVVRKQIMTIAQGSKVLSLATSRLGKVKLNIPSQKEQQKIATYLSAIDKKIEAVQTQITKTQAFKKGLLQQMFV